MSTKITTLLWQPLHHALTILQQLSIYYCLTKAFIYDAIILRMTKKWYRAVLERLDDGSIILDVGIGAAGALLCCHELTESKDLKVIGIDIDLAYAEAGKIAVKEAGLANRIIIEKIDVYKGREFVFELAKKLGVAPDANGGFLDAVYFSGSFSLLPDPVKALKLKSTFVKDKGNNHGTIYITQTYQRKMPLLLTYVKPLLKYVTAIDFGQLVREEKVLNIFFAESGLELFEHNVIPGSIDTRFQAA